LIWPFAIARAGFIIKMIDDAFDRTNEDVISMRTRVMKEFEGHLREGPFLGGREKPSLADFSAYPMFMGGWLMGMKGSFDWKNRPRILTWLKRVQDTLPDNPLPCNDHMVLRKFPWQESSSKL